MSRAQKSNALHKELFHFRKDITTQETPPEPKAQCQSAKCGANCAPVYSAMSIDQIVNGKVINLFSYNNYCLGVITVVDTFLRLTMFKVSVNAQWVTSTDCLSLNQAIQLVFWIFVTLVTIVAFFSN